VIASYRCAGRAVLSLAWAPAALLAMLALAATPAPAAASQSICPDDQLQPAAGVMDRVDNAIICRLNAERRLNGQPAFHRIPSLDRSSQFQSDDMVSHHYFAEQQSGRSTVYARVAAFGYFGNALGGLYAENIGTGPLQEATADGLVTAWMGSAEHRNNILDARLQDVGIGAALTGPDPAFYSNYSAAVYTTDFGWRNVPQAHPRRVHRRAAACPRSLRRPSTRTATPRRGWCPRSRRR
jgi:uncharacterized protein YkwD